MPGESAVMVVLVAVTVVLLSAVFLSRSVYRFMAPTHVDGDAYDFLLQIQDIKAAGHRRPEEPSQVVTSGVYSYPYLLPWVLSFCPARHLPLVERYFSGLADLAIGILIVAMAPLGPLTLEQVDLALLLFVFTPQFVRPNLSHGNGLSARKPGLLLVSTSLLGLSAWIVSGSVPAFSLAVLAGGFTMLTSKFGLQAWIAVVLVLSVGLAPLAILVVPLALAVAALLTWGRYLHIFEGHLQHLADYATAKQYKRFDHSLPNPVSWVRSLLAADGTRDRLELLYETRWLRAIVDTPFVPLVVLIAAETILTGEAFPVAPPLALWIGALVAAFVVTSLPHLLFLGQAERYFEYALVPSLILIARRWTTSPEVVTPLVLGGILVGIVTQLAYAWAYRNLFVSPERDAAVKRLVAALRDLDPGVVLVQPAYLARQIAYETDHHVVERLAGNSQSTERASREINRLFPETYDFVTADVDWLAETYDPDWVVFDLAKLREESEVGIHDAPGLAPPDGDPIWSGNGFEVYPFDRLVGDVA